MLTVVDSSSRDCLAIVVTRRLRADDVLQVLADLFISPDGRTRSALTRF
jgi:hypothetical protein